MNKIVEKREQACSKLKETLDDLPAVYEFIRDVYVLGLYSEPKVYTRLARPHVKSLDAAIIELALHGAMIKSNQNSVAKKLFALAEIRLNVEGHYWRANRIVEDMQT